jgi:hypothetical protein
MYLVYIVKMDLSPHQDSVLMINNVLPNKKKTEQVMDLDLGKVLGKGLEMDSGKGLEMDSAMDLGKEMVLLS